MGKQQIEILIAVITIFVIVFLGFYIFTTQKEIEPPLTCSENWQCTPWTECILGKRFRACTDINSCGTKLNKPVIEENCIPILPPPVPPPPASKPPPPAPPTGVPPPVPPSGIPQAPSDLSIIAIGYTRVVLNWTDNAHNENGYVVERSVNGSNFSQIASLNANAIAYNDLAISQNTTYAYQVKAYNAFGESSSSNIVVITIGFSPEPLPPPPPPGPPSGPPPAGVPPPPPSGQQVEIIRDLWGVQHVFANTDNEAFFGWGYAAAEDRLFQMHYTRRRMQGRISELIGLKNQNGGSTSVEEDKRIRTMQFEKYATERFNNLDSETKSLLAAYSAGVNKYIADNANNLHYLFGGIMPEVWTPVDSLLTWDHLVIPGFSVSEATELHRFEVLVQQLGSREAAAAAMLDVEAIDETAATVQQSDVPISTRNAMQSYANQHPPFASNYLPKHWAYITPNIVEPKGSHAWVVGGSRSTTGNSFLFSQPQLRISFPNVWQEIHVQGGTFNVRGTSVPGMPGIFIGFNTNVAWGATSLPADVSDLYRLKMLSSNTYEYNGQAHTFETSQETILVKNGSSQSITVRDSILGPVVTSYIPNASAGEEYAVVGIPNWDTNRHTIQGLIKMMRATTVTSFNQALADYRWPSVNYIFGDSGGNIGYHYAAAVPTRSSLSPLAGFIAQDGSSSSYAWVESVPASLRPQVINPQEGAIASANNLPVGRWYPIQLGAHPINGGDTYRVWRLKELLFNLSPHYNAPTKLSPSYVRDIYLDAIHPAKREIVRGGLHLRDNQGVSLSQNSLEALQYLDRWYNNNQARNLTSFPFQALVHYLAIDFQKNDAPNLTALWGPRESGQSRWLRDMKQRLDTDGINAILTQDEILYIDKVLQGAWQKTVVCFGSDPLSWKNKYLNGPAPTGSGCGTEIPAQFTANYFQTEFDFFEGLDPQYNKTFTGLLVVEGHTMRSQRGQSYSQWVDFSNINSAETLSPFGNSEHPTSLFFTNQVNLWLNGQLHSAPLTKSQIQANQYSGKTINF